MIKNSDQREWRVRMLLLHGAMLVAPAALLAIHGRFRINGLGICVFKEIFGFDCPACGVTRSVMAMFSGHISQSFHLHPAGPLVIVILGIMTLYLVIVLLTGHRGLEWGKEAKAYSTLEGLSVGVLLVGWICRLLMN